MKTCPMTYKILPHWYKIYQIAKNPQIIAQDFEDFAKIAKFRQIWSHSLCYGKISFAAFVPDF